jgi:indole-3-glycerol phosphate synthase
VYREADALYAFITQKPKKTAKAQSSESKIFKADIIGKRSDDILTKSESSRFNDELDATVVSKRDPESAHPVRVASMDYFVPEKMPQPKNVLESLVWDREQDIDRMRERFQLTRALSQAKLSEAKYPKRDLFQKIRDFNAGTGAGTGSDIPPLLVELSQASFYNGFLVDNKNLASLSLTDFIQELQGISNVIALGSNADSGTFRGKYEDLSVLKLSSSLPVFCNDFVVYAYQIFQAKSSGSDSIKLMASVLTTQDLTYLVKIAKAFGLTCIVVVSSKVQLLDVLANVPDLQALSVTSRNMRLWKVRITSIRVTHY